MTVHLIGEPSRGRIGPAPYLLPRLLAPFPDESLPGLILRYSELFGYREPRRLLIRTGADDLILWTLCQEDPGGGVGSRLGSLLGLDGETFRRMSLHTGDEATIRVLGVPIWRELARHDSRAVCTACLRDSPHHRAIWMINALPVCAVHGTWLMARCPRKECARPLRWSGMGAHRCDRGGCRCDLRGFDTPAIDEGRLGGVRGLHDLLHQADGSRSPLGMPRGEALRMAFVLGQHAFGHERSTRPKSYIGRERERLPEIIDAGWNALRDWPRGFHGFLDAVSARAPSRKGKAGFVKSFGRLSKRVYLWGREPWGAPMGVAFARYAAENPDLAVSGHQLRRYAPGTDLRHVHVSLGEAKDLLGASMQTVIALAKKHDLYVRASPGSGVPALLRADRVRDLLPEFRSSLTPEEARKRLGVGYRIMEQLERGGLVRPMPPDERFMVTKPYRGSELDAFVAACASKAPRMTEQAAGKAELTPITRLAAPGRSVPDVCRALMEGRLRATGVIRGRRGLSALRFRMEDVGRAVPASRETMSLVQAAAKLSVAYRHLHVWSRKGLLRTTASDRPGERGLRVTGEALAAFRADYLIGGELATLFGQPDNFWLSRHLLFQGVRPVSGPGADEGELTVFRRADVTPEVMEAVRKVQARPPGTGQEKHRAAFAKGKRAADAVAAAWGVRFDRTHNRFTDPDSGRTLQVVSGRRPDLTGVFRFMVNKGSLERLRSLADAWVALVPAQGDAFVLARPAAIRWRDSGNDRYVTLRFDAAGEPLDTPEGAVTVTLETEGAG